MASREATVEPNVSTSIGTSRLARYGLLAVILASVVNALVLLTALGAFDVPAEYDPLGWGPVLVSSIVGALGATIVYGLLARVSNRPNRAFTIIAAVVLIVSFVPLVSPPAELAGAPISVLVTLGGMHVTTAAVAVGVLLYASESGVGSQEV